MNSKITTVNINLSADNIYIYIYIYIENKISQSVKQALHLCITSILIIKFLIILFL